MEIIIDYCGEKNWKDQKELSEMSGREARKYYLWFIEQIENRICYLEKYLNEHSLNIKLDYSEKSLEKLWVWYINIQKKIRRKYDTQPEEKKMLGNQMKMLRKDISIYFGETLIHNHTQLKWDYVKKTKLFYDYHQPAIYGFKNPTHRLVPWIVLDSLSANAVTQENYNNSLLDLYKIWEEYI